MKFSAILNKIPILCGNNDFNFFINCDSRHFEKVIGIVKKYSWT